MVERFMGLLPSIVVLCIIAVSFSIFLRIIESRWFGKESQKDNTVWLYQWAKSNKKKGLLLYCLPALSISTPSREELIFRAPLLVFFGTVSGLAWLGIIASAIVFSLMHFISPANKSILKTTRIIERECLGEELDPEGDENEEEDKKKTIRKVKMIRGVNSFIFGVLIGYLGVRYQSLWLCVGIHAGWNLVVPIVLPILILIFAFVVMFIKNKTMRR